MRTPSLITTLALSLVSASAFTQQNPQTVRNYGKLPLSFEMNKGQTDKRVNFMSRGQGYALFLTPNEAVFSLSKSQAKPKNGKKCAPVTPSVLRMKLLGANPSPKSVGEAKLPGTVNYFKGNDPKKWHTNIGTYGKVRYQSVYKGIDQVFYGNQRKLEYDFVVSPFADYKQVKMEFEGAKSVKLLPNGDLQLSLKGGSVVWQVPLIYQEANGKRVKVMGKYTLRGKKRVGFEVAKYDKSKPLVIDPVLAYSTFLGGSEIDSTDGIKVDSDGNAYITGETYSTDFPTTVGAFDITHNGGVRDVFVTKMNSNGTALIYSTYLGSSKNEDIPRLAIDTSGNAYIAGYTYNDAFVSIKFPTTPGAFNTTYNSGSCIFLTKLNPTGSALIYSTLFYLSDSFSLTADNFGCAYIAGTTPNATIPTTPGAYKSNSERYDTFAAKFSPNGSTLVYCTLLGGLNTGYATVRGIALDSEGNLIIAGYRGGAGVFPTTQGAYDRTYNGGDVDVYVTKLNATGTALIYSTYIGSDGTDTIGGFAVDSAGNVYLLGFSVYPNSSANTNFPVTPGAYRTTGLSFLAKLDSTGGRLVYSTRIPFLLNMAVDSTGHVYAAGYADNAGFPVTPGAITPYSGRYDMVMAKFNTNGTKLLYGTYMGGSSSDLGDCIAVDSAGGVYIAGRSFNGTDFPTTPAAFQESNSGFEVFVAKILFERSPSITLEGVTTNYEARIPIQSTLTRPDTGTPYADKIVVFQINGETIKTMKTNSEGVAAFEYELGSRPVGTYNLTARFVGDTDYDPIIASASLRVLRSGVKFILTPTVLTTKYRLGQPMSPAISFTMRRTSDNALLPNETFDIQLDGGTIGTVTTDANGIATLPYTPPASLGVGSKVLKALYTATTNYSGLTTGWNLSFLKTPTGITAPSVAGNRNAAVNLTATLTNKDTTAPLEGKTLHFFVGGMEVGTGVTNASGVATLPYTLPNTAGKLTLIVTYNGDDLLANSSRQTLITVR